MWREGRVRLEMKGTYIKGQSVDPYAGDSRWRTGRRKGGGGFGAVTVKEQKVVKKGGTGEEEEEEVTRGAEKNKWCQVLFK